MTLTIYSTVLGLLVLCNCFMDQGAARENRPRLRYDQNVPFYSRHPSGSYKRPFLDDQSEFSNMPRVQDFDILSVPKPALDWTHYPYNYDPSGWLLASRTCDKFADMMLNTQGAFANLQNIFRCFWAARQDPKFEFGRPCHILDDFKELVEATGLPSAAVWRTLLDCPQFFSYWKPYTFYTSDHSSGDVTEDNSSKKSPRFDPINNFQSDKAPNPQFDSPPRFPSNFQSDKATNPQSDSSPWFPNNFQSDKVQNPQSDSPRWLLSNNFQSSKAPYPQFDSSPWFPSTFQSDKTPHSQSDSTTVQARPEFTPINRPKFLILAPVGTMGYPFPQKNSATNNLPMPPFPKPYFFLPLPPHKPYPIWQSKLFSGPKPPNSRPSSSSLPQFPNSSFQFPDYSEMMPWIEPMDSDNNSFLYSWDSNAYPTLQQDPSIESPPRKSSAKQDDETSAGAWPNSGKLTYGRNGDGTSPKNDSKHQHVHHYLYGQNISEVANLIHNLKGCNRSSLNLHFHIHLLDTEGIQREKYYNGTVLCAGRNTTNKIKRMTRNTNLQCGSITLSIDPAHKDAAEWNDSNSPTLKISLKVIPHHQLLSHYSSSLGKTTTSTIDVNAKDPSKYIKIANANKAITIFFRLDSDDHFACYDPNAPLNNLENNFTWDAPN